MSHTMGSKGLSALMEEQVCLFKARVRNFLG